MYLGQTIMRWLAKIFEMKNAQPRAVLKVLFAKGPRMVWVG